MLIQPARTFMTAEQLRRDQRFIFRDLPAETITCGNQTVPCLVPDDLESNDWIDGGNEDQPRASVIVERSTLFVPKRGEHASYRAQQWRIANVKRDHENSPIRIDLEKAT